MGKVFNNSKTKLQSNVNTISLFFPGETPLLHLARRNSSPTIRKILESKNVRDNELLDLSVKSGEGKTVLHYLVENKDEQVFQIPES